MTAGPAAPNGTGSPDANGATPAPKRRLIDLRSDTVTRPCAKMLAAMMSAEVGDDVWGDDPTVNALQEYAAALFGHEAALFCPSGTMTNQIAIKVHTQPGDELICADTAHIVLYEGGGVAFNSGVQPKLLPSDRGRITAAQVEAAINAEDVHFPPTRLVCLENTANKGGGAYYSLQAMQEISALCRARGLALHLDGARLMNACAAGGYTPLQVGALFDSVSLCLSKGLGCPVGSLLTGSRDFIRRAHRFRKVFGGGMRQAGFLAGAGLYALQHNVERLREDHERAGRLGAALEALRPMGLVGHVAAVDTNIVIFSLAPPADPKAFVEALRGRGVLISSMGPGVLRLVTHLDVDEADIQAVCGALAEVGAEWRRRGALGPAIDEGKEAGAARKAAAANGIVCGYGAAPAAVSKAAAAAAPSAGTAAALAALTEAATGLPAAANGHGGGGGGTPALSGE